MLKYSSRAMRSIIAVLSIALIISLGINLILFIRSCSDYQEVNRVRLDPLGLEVFPTPQDTVTKTKSIVVFYGDSRAQNWRAPMNMPQVQFVNRGIGAQTTAQVLGRFDAHIASINPDIVVIQVGINDLKTIALFPDQKTAIIQRCKQNIESMVAASKKVGSKVLLTTIFPTGVVPIERRLFWSDEIPAAVQEVNTYIKSLQSDDVVIFDSAVFLADGSGVLSERYSKDTIHINAAGYQVLNEALVQILTVMVEAK